MEIQHATDCSVDGSVAAPALIEVPSAFLDPTVNAKTNIG
jgi:hypothetical protein